MTEVTKILEQIEHGDTAAAAELLPLVYAELRKLAGYRLNREKNGQTLQATALVHEAYLRLVGNAQIKWDGRSHFFAAAAEAMRRILVDQARRRQSIRHGGGFERQELTKWPLNLVTLVSYSIWMQLSQGLLRKILKPQNSSNFATSLG